MTNWNLISASTIGHRHRHLHQPNQDAHFVFRVGNYQIGFVTDGCGGAGEYSYIGSNLGILFLARRTKQLIEAKIPQSSLPRHLFGNLKAFLRATSQAYRFSTAEEPDFRNRYLLFTILGFIVGPRLTQIITCGDGIIVINGHPLYLDQDNRPHYAAYAALPDTAAATSNVIPTGFSVWEIPTHRLWSLAIGSDAWRTRPDLLEQAIAFPTSTDLQKAVNRWGIINDFFADQDDATLAVAQRLVWEE